MLVRHNTVFISYSFGTYYISSMSYLIRLSIGYLLLHGSFVHASPTANEFVRCDKIAVAVLDHCLGDKGMNCWAGSKAAYEACREDVVRSHNPDPERIKAIRATMHEGERGKGTPE